MNPPRKRFGSEPTQWYRNQIGERGDLSLAVWSGWLSTAGSDVPRNPKPQLASRRIFWYGVTRLRCCMRRMAIGFGLALATALLSASSAQAGMVTYPLNLSTSLGNPVTDILILESDGTQVHA